mgnify:CR=1 FL=1
MLVVTPEEYPFMAYMTWLEMFGNGYRIGTVEPIIEKVGEKTLRGLKRANLKSSGEVLG